MFSNKRRFQWLLFYCFWILLCIDLVVSCVILALVKITSEIFVQVREHSDVDESVVLDTRMFFSSFDFRVG